jgi:hypothetical protein
MVETPDGSGRVVGRNVPGETLIVRMSEDGRRSSCPVASVCGSRRTHETRDE